MSKKSSFKKNISETFDIPQETVLDIPDIRILGNNELSIENHKGIIEYTREMLRMNSKLGVIKVTGDNLHIKEIDQCSITICGEINSLEFIK